ncbi:hypothetical protein OKJ48_24765 [Streptomyces kunmingensis]|uniref:Small CPxCG-related zinc finger protein n=1 Tax=Streptomyces kunmingensis TaxID=68225 RepID=A0ABU6CFN9_9ACTN|nr:hypothetical protein [Streptomyces kunmingensis]MEB3963432.1 hypothetical protein [Streptomyces kunmingensis]
MTSLPGGDSAQQTHPQDVVCARCGTTAQGPPLTWTCSVEGGVRRYFCDACAREHIRAIEGRLDSEWW